MADPSLLPCFEELPGQDTASKLLGRYQNSNQVSQLLGNVPDMQYDTKMLG